MHELHALRHGGQEVGPHCQDQRKAIGRTKSVDRMRRSDRLWSTVPVCRPVILPPTSSFSRRTARLFRSAARAPRVWRILLTADHAEYADSFRVFGVFGGSHRRTSRWGQPASAPGIGLGVLSLLCQCSPVLSCSFGGESRLILGEIVNRRWTRMLYLCSSVCIGGYIPGQGPEMFEDMNISPNQRWIERG